MKKIFEYLKLCGIVHIKVILIYIPYYWET